MSSSRFVVVEWKGSSRDFVSTFGRFRKNRPVKLSESDARFLLTLSEGFQTGEYVLDENHDPIEIFYPSNIGTFVIRKLEEGSLNLGFARQYGFGDMIVVVMFVCRSAKLQDPNGRVTLYVPASYVNFFSTFSFLDDVRPYPANFKEQREYDKYIDLNRVPEFHSANSKNISRAEILASIIENPIYEFPAYRPDESYVKEARDELSNRNKDNRKIVVVSTVASSKIRTYPPAKLGRLLEHLTKEFFVILLGTDNFKWGLKQWNGENLFSLIDKTPDLIKLAAYMACCDHAITTDHGLMHLLGIMKVPTLALYGNLYPEAGIKFYPSVTALFPRNEISCIPCGDKFNPCPRTNEEFGGACLNLLTPGKVMSAFEEIILEREPKKDELYRKIIQMGAVKEAKLDDKEYPYFPSKVTLLEEGQYRVLIVVPHIFMGGGETQLAYLLKAIGDLQFSIELVVLGSIDTDLFPVIAKLVKTTVLNLKTGRIQTLRKKIQEFNPHVILYHATSDIIEALDGLERKPIVIQILHTGVGPWTEDVLKAGMKYNDCAIAVGDWIRKRFKRLYPALRISTVNNGVPVVSNRIGKSLRRQLKIKEDDFVIGCMSRFGSEKRISLMMQALSWLPENVKLLLAGWGAQEKQLRRAAEKYKNRVIFAGVIRKREDFFKTVDCCILVSITEGNSMFVLESAIAKKPLILTSVGSAPDFFVDKKSALFVDPDAESIGRAVSVLMEDKSLASTLADNACDVITKVGTDAIMAQGYRGVMLAEIMKRIYPSQILCFRGGGGGDIIMTTPAVRFLKRNFPHAILTYLISKDYADILRGNPYIDNLLVLRHPANFSDIARQYDVAFNFQHWEVWDTYEHIIDHNLQLVGGTKGDRNLDVNLDGIKQLNIETPYVCIHTKSNFECKNWGTRQQWGEIVKFLKEKYTVVQIGDANEPNYEGALSALGLSYRESAMVLKGASFFVGIDSFPVHAAKAVNCRSVVIYGGSSNSAFCGYKNNENVISNCSCKCDLSKGSAVKCSKKLMCLNFITTEEVIDAIETLEIKLRS